MTEDLPLGALVTAISACRICRDRPVGDPLPHEPRPVVQLSDTARILIAGQAPGARVHASGRPFDDRSGDRLRAWMDVDAATFHDAARIAILPMGFCYPGSDPRGGDRPPRPECPPAWRRAVLDRLPAVDLVLAVGLHAQRWHLGAAAGSSLTATVADFRRFLARTDGPALLPLPHPSWHNTAWIAANPWFAADLLPQLRRLVADRLRPAEAAR